MAVHADLWTTPWVLALVAVLGFGLYTVVMERGMARAGAERSPVMAAAFFSTIVAVAAFWVLAAVRGVPVDALTPAKVAPFVVAGVAYPALFRVAYYEGIDRVGASISAAVMGAYPAVSAVLAVWTLGESLSVAAAGGIALIVAGVVALQLAQNAEDDSDGDLQDVVSRKLSRSDPVDLAYPVLAMLLVGGSYVLIKYGLDRFPDAVTATAITQTPALVVFGGWALSSRAARAQLRLAPVVVGAFVFAGAFNVVGWLGQFFALQVGTVVTVVPLLNTFPLAVMVFSYALAREVPRSPRIIAAVLAIVVGATFVQVFG